MFSTLSSLSRCAHVRDSSRSFKNSREIGFFAFLYLPDPAHANKPFGHSFFFSFRIFLGPPADSISGAPLASRFSYPSLFEIGFQRASRFIPPPFDCTLLRCRHPLPSPPTILPLCAKFARAPVLHGLLLHRDLKHCPTMLVLCFHGDP